MKNSVFITICLISIVLLSPPTNASENGQGQKVEDAMAFVEESKTQQISVGFEYRIEQVRYKFKMLVTTVIATIIFLIIVLFYMDRGKKFAPSDIANLSGLVLVIQAILVSVIVALTSEQLTAAIGALGAIAGYLFGRTKARTTKDKPIPT